MYSPNRQYSEMYAFFRSTVLYLTADLLLDYLRLCKSGFLDTTADRSFRTRVSYELTHRHREYELGQSRSRRTSIDLYLYTFILPIRLSDRNATYSSSLSSLPVKFCVFSDPLPGTRRSFVCLHSRLHRVHYEF